MSDNNNEKREIERLKSIIYDLMESEGVIDDNIIDKVLNNKKVYCRECFREFDEIHIKRRTPFRVFLDGFVYGVAILVFLFILAVIITLSNK